MKKLFLLFLLPLAGFASSISVSSQVCIIFPGNCSTGDTASGGSVINGATGLGSTVTDTGSNSQGTFWGATATAVLDYGSFRGEATADFSSLVASVGDFVNAVAGGIQIETWTIHDPSGQHAPGSLGLYQLTYTISGGMQLSAGLDGEASADFGIQIFYGPTLSGSASIAPILGGGVYSLSKPIQFQYDVPFEVFIEYSLNAGVAKSADGPPPFQATAGAFFQDTATLTGTQALDFFTQDPVSGTTLTSDSGAIYPLSVPTEDTSAVPEPSMLWFAAAAALAIILPRRRRA